MKSLLPAGASIGLVFGALVALAFALIIRFIPEAWFVESNSRALLFVFAAIAAPPTVLLTRVVAAKFGHPRQIVQDWGTIGAITFDGVMIGFWPALYGQEGEALIGVATMLLFAFASLICAGQLMNKPWLEERQV